MDIVVKQTDNSDLPSWLSVSKKSITPNLAGVVATNRAMGVALSDKHAYVADYGDGLKIIDISDPENPDLVSSLDMSGYAYGVAIENDYVYVASYDKGLKIIDVTLPSSPTLKGSIDTAGFAYDVAVSGDYAYVADYDKGLKIIDITQPMSPALIGSIDTAGFAYGVAVAGNYAFIADYNDGLKIIDISDPATPFLVTALETAGDACGVTVDGSYVYVADWGKGLQIVDISDPSNPKIVGTVDTDGAVYDVAILGNYAYLADRTEGLKVVDVTNSSSPFLAGAFNTAGDAYGVAASGDHAYVADYIGGLKVIGGVGEGLLLNGTSSESDLGTLNLKITANDSMAAVSTPFSINVLAKKYDPTISKVTYNGAKNTAIQFDKDDFLDAFSDADGDPLTKIQIRSLPSYGELKKSGVIVTLDDEINVEDISDLSFAPQVDWGGTTKFKWRAFDGTSYSNEADVSIEVSANLASEMWSNVWWPVITAGSVAAVGVPFAIITAIISKKAKICCFKGDKKTISINDNIELVVNEEK